jgi:hypothetical protein
MTTSAQIREAIAEHLEYQSEWRAQKAEEYPEDDRNRIVADAHPRLGRARPQAQDSEKQPGRALYRSLGFQRRTPPASGST